ESDLPAEFRTSWRVRPRPPAADGESMGKSSSPSALSPTPMDDRNLILGVLAAQAGFVTPAQVMSAASMRMLARDGRSLLDHLVDSGALTPERRDLVMA